MKRILGQAAVICLLAATIWIIGGCDNAKDADLPLQPYHLVRTYPMSGSAEDVLVRGNYVAVALGDYGAILYNRSQPDALTPVFTYRPINPQSHATHVAFDPDHTVLAVYTHSAQETRSSALFDFSKDSAHAEIQLSAAIVSGPLEGFDIDVRQDTIIFWGTDTSPANDWGLTRKAFEKTTDTAMWMAYGANCQYQPPRGQARGFERRLSDGVFAVANDEAGIFLFDPQTCDSFSVLNTPGISRDCAWAGNLVVVVDEYSVIIVDATNLRDPVLLSATTISTGSTSFAHRLRKVTVDGNYVCAADDIEGIFVLDISNPRSPQVVQRIAMYDPTNVSASNGTLYATSMNTGLYVFQR
jgi:hypothetical protein